MYSLAPMIGRIIVQPRADDWKNNVAPMFVKSMAWKCDILMFSLAVEHRKEERWVIRNKLSLGNGDRTQGTKKEPKE